MQAEAAKADGTKARAFEGEGDRQYLTGLKVGGARILIAVDKSASMLDETIVNVLRRRNMDEARKLEAPKWKRTVATTDWLIAQLPLESQFQILTFDVEAKSLFDDNELARRQRRRRISIRAVKIDADRSCRPAARTCSTWSRRLTALSPPPDNVYLVTDGLPTQGAKAAARHDRDRTATARAVRRRARTGAGRHSGQRDPLSDGRRSVRCGRVLGTRALDARRVPHAVEGLAMSTCTPTPRADGPQHVSSST